VRQLTASVADVCVRTLAGSGVRCMVVLLAPESRHCLIGVPLAW